MQITPAQVEPGDVVVDTTQWNWTLQVLNATTEPPSPTGQQGFFCPGNPSPITVPDTDVLDLVVRGGTPV